MVHISSILATQCKLQLHGKAKFVYTKYHFQLILIRFPTRLSLPVRAKKGGGEQSALFFFSHLLFSGKKPPSPTKCMWSGCRLFITPTKGFPFYFLTPIIAPSSLLRSRNLKARTLLNIITSHFLKVSLTW